MARTMNATFKVGKSVKLKDVYEKFAKISDEYDEDTQISLSIEIDETLKEHEFKIEMG